MGRATIVFLAATLALGAPAGAAESSQRAAGAGDVVTVAGPGVCPGPGTVDPASNAIGGLVVDGAGTLFVDAGLPALGMVTRVDVSGAATTLRTAGPGGTPGRLAADGAGGLLVAAKAHIDHHRAGGGVIPLAGDRLATRTTPSSGDGGPAADARFVGILGLTTDLQGNVYVADAVGADGGGVRIRFINRTSQPVTLYQGTPSELVVAPGHIDTIVGRGATGQVADPLRGDPPAMAATAGRLYLASHDPSAQPAVVRVQVVNLGGADLAAHGVQVPPAAIQTVAGGGPVGFAGDDGPAVSARLGRLPGIAADEAGTLYLADAEHHRVRRVDQDGVITTLAGAGPIARGGFNGNDQPAINARLDQPSAVAAGPKGQVFIADRGNAQVRVVNSQGVINAAPGNGLHRTWICEENGKPLPPGASRPLPVGPRDVAVAGNGDVYFPVASNAGRNASPIVYRLEPSGRVAPVLGGAKDLLPCPGCEKQPITLPDDAHLARPIAVAAGLHGGLYVLDADGGRLWLANPGAKELRAHGLTVAPGAAVTAATDTMRKGAPGGSLAADQRGNVFISDLHKVRRLDDQGQLTTVVEGSSTLVGGSQVPPREREVAAATCCAAPAGLAVDGRGNLYVGDIHAARVWYLNQGDQPITVHGQHVAPGAWAPVAGSGKSGFEGDNGPAVEAQFDQLARLAVDPRGNLYIADVGEHTVRRVDPTGKITTVAGSGNPGFNGDGLPAGVTSLNTPSGIAVDGCGSLLIADTVNQRLRRWNAARPCATPARAGAPQPAGGRSSTLVAVVGVGLLLSTVGAFGILRHRRRRADDQPRDTQPEAASSASNSSANLQADFIAIAKPHCHTAIAGPTDAAPETPEKTVDKETQ